MVRNRRRPVVTRSGAIAGPRRGHCCRVRSRWPVASPAHSWAVLRERTRRGGARRRKRSIRKCERSVGCSWPLHRDGPPRGLSGRTHHPPGVTTRISRNRWCRRPFGRDCGRSGVSLWRVAPSRIRSSRALVPLAHPITRESYVSFAEEPTTGRVLLGTVALTLALGGSLALVGYTLGVAARLEFGDLADRRPWVTAVGHGTLLLAPVTVLAFVLLPVPLAIAGFGLPLGCGVLVFSAN